MKQVVTGVQPTTATVPQTVPTKEELWDVDEEWMNAPMGNTIPPIQPLSHLLGHRIEAICTHVAQCSECKDQLAKSMLSYGMLVLDVPGNLLPSILAKQVIPSYAELVRAES